VTSWGWKKGGAWRKGPQNIQPRKLGNKENALFKENTTHAKPQASTRSTAFFPKPKKELGKSRDLGQTGWPFFKI
jgi:hypothetical protein